MIPSLTRLSIGTIQQKELMQENQLVRCVRYNVAGGEGEIEDGKDKKQNEKDLAIYKQI